MDDLTVNLVVADSGLGFPRTWVAQPVSMPPPWILGTGPDPWSAFFDLLARLHLEGSA